MKSIVYILLLLFISSSFDMIAQDTLNNEPQEESPNADSFENPEKGTFVFSYPYKSKELTEAASLDSPKLNTMVYKSEETTVMAIGALNVARGSVRVTAGDQQLQEGIDYTVNYQAGTVQILDPSWEALAVPIKVSIEK